METERTPERALEAVNGLHENAVRSGYRGWEFDDVLAGRIPRALAGNSLLRQRVAIQVGERVPLNIRPLLRVPKLDSAKARGFFARGYLRLYAWSSDRRWLDAAVDCLDWLLEHPSAGYAGLAWGNEFDFASRAGFFPRHLPTVVWSAHIGETMALAASIMQDGRYAEAVQRVAHFIATDLGMSEDERGVVFNYSPGVPARIHNSNLLGAALLARAAYGVHAPQWRDLAVRSYRWSLSHLQPDGSWLYGVGARYRWCDSFHTAYVIESLLSGHELLGEVVPWSVIERSVAYWTGRFFGADGKPRYYDNQTYPLDIQCAAQAIETLSRLSARFPECAALATRVVMWTLDHMRKPNGAFRYQIIRPGVRNELESIHWGQSTMLSALGTYLETVGSPRT